MAAPAKPLMTIYDASQLRVTVSVPQSIVNSLAGFSTSKATVTIGHDQKINIPNIQILPAADQTTHTRTIRLNLPKDLPNVAPGMHVKVTFPVTHTTSKDSIFIPNTALVKHAEMTAVYVISQAGEPLLRQLRLGEIDGDQVEILSGLSIGEEIAMEPQHVAGSL
jgi:multidrug efflux pump subunit AcrA (membrane-fusion protein)